MVIDILVDCIVFNRVDRTYLEYLLKSHKISEVKKGDYVFRQADQGMGMYVVLEGKLKVFLEYTNGIRTLAEIGKGSFIGEVSMLISQKRTASVKALEDSRLFYFDGETFKRQIDNNDKNALRIGYNLAQVLALRLTKSNEVIRSIQLTPTGANNRTEIAKFRDLLKSEVLL